MKYKTLAVIIGLAVASQGCSSSNNQSVIASSDAKHKVETAKHAGATMYTREVTKDVVTNSFEKSEHLGIISNESDSVWLGFYFNSDGTVWWVVGNSEPLNDWFSDTFMESETTVLYRTPRMRQPISAELEKSHAGTGTSFISHEINHARRMLASKKVAVKICGENFTFDLTHPDVAKGRDAMGRCLIL